MVGTAQNIVNQVYAAKTDLEAADALISQYMGFIRSETVKFTHTSLDNGHEDELSIAMLAFYEAILGYEKTRGAFLPYAARAIRNRLVDYYRVEKRHRNVTSLHAPAEVEPERPMLETLPDHRDEVSAYENRTGQPAGDPGIRAPSWPGLGSLSPMWQTTVPNKSGRWPPAAGC